MFTVKKFDFKASGAAQGKYEWPKLLNGDIHVLECGEGKDFAGKPETMSSLIRGAAAKRGQTVVINSLSGGDTDPRNSKATMPEGFVGIIFQAQDKPDAAKAEKYAAHQKQLLKDRKAAKTSTAPVPPGEEPEEATEGVEEPEESAETNEE